MNKHKMSKNYFFFFTISIFKLFVDMFFSIFNIFSLSKQSYFNAAIVLMV